MSDLLQLLIMAVIVVGIAIAIFRSGSANPEPTGRLRRSIDELRGKVELIELDLRHSASTSDVQTLRVELAGYREVVDATKASVDRIEGYLIERALGGKS